MATAALASWATERVEVQGRSMTPTFDDGDRLLLVRRYRRLRVGDVVALRDPTDDSRWLVKRVRAVAGEAVEVAGDNPDGSTDSRTFGPVPRTSVTHLVVRRYATARP